MISRYLISLAIYSLHFLVAGTLEALVAMAQKHLERGVASPFLVRNYLARRCPGNNAGIFP